MIPKSSTRLPLRLFLFAALAVGVALLIGLLVTTLNGALELVERINAAPIWVRLPLIALIGLALGMAIWLVWRWWGPSAQRRAKVVAPPRRDEVQSRLDALRERRADIASLETELVDLDQRRSSGDLHVALFGEISAGKSSLIKALAADADVAIDVRGGTTQRVEHFRCDLGDGIALLLADVPGSREIDGAAHERLAREEALRAHAVVYVAASDMTASQDAELRWLAGFGKPLVIALSKSDQYSTDELEQLLTRLRQRYSDVANAVVPVSAARKMCTRGEDANGEPMFIFSVRDDVVDPLVNALQRVTAGGAASLEPAREAAVLSSVDQRSADIARVTAATEAQACVARYTRRAIVGAMAAVAPGSDIIIQGALGTGLVRELARIHEIPARDIDIDALLKRLGLSVRNTTAIVLAIAGNALKAFPGLGTLGGGVMHAIAYGLVFDSVGTALADSLAERQQLDLADAEQRVQTLLQASGRERIERIARLTLETLRKPNQGVRDD
ncbi:MAG: GTPase [Dokdonella sp.]